VNVPPQERCTKPTVGLDERFFTDRLYETGRNTIPLQRPPPSAAPQALIL
jgi:hypothetical protein